MGFAVKANHTLIYTGYFRPAGSSLTCSWVVIDPLWIRRNYTMKVELGYPELTDEMTISDRRNDSRILDISGGMVN